MNKCLYCGKLVNNKYCDVTCQNKHQGSERANNKFGVIKEFKVNCNICQKQFTVLEREKLFPTKEKYYCNRSCANKRSVSSETKELIRQSLKKQIIKKESLVKNTVNNHTKINKICEHCGKEFSVIFKKRKQRFCSRSCVSKFINERIKINKSKKLFIKIKKENQPNKITYIYSLEYPLGNIKYIGKADNPRTRLNKHIYEAKTRNKNHKDHWINSINDIPILNIIEQVTYNDWQEKEIYWIKYYTDNGCKLVNGTLGGEGSNGFQNKHHTEKTKQILRDIRKFQIISEETKVKLRGENSSVHKLTDNDIREIFKLVHINKKNHKEIAKQFNINQKYVHMLLSGKRRVVIYNEYLNNSII